jgi:hypothetical protein
VEAEGCFYVNKNLLLDFILPQSSKDLVLMEAIRDYFHTLKVEGKIYSDVVNVRLQDNMIYLRIHRTDFITNVLIPFFDNIS